MTEGQEKPYEGELDQTHTREGRLPAHHGWLCAYLYSIGRGRNSGRDPNGYPSSSANFRTSMRVQQKVEPGQDGG